MLQPETPPGADNRDAITEVELKLTSNPVLADVGPAALVRAWQLKLCCRANFNEARRLSFHLCPHNVGFQLSWLLRVTVFKPLIFGNDLPPRGGKTR
jgi:hypothetical protein